MNIDYQTIIAGLALIISALSYQTAKKSLKISQEQRKDDKRKTSSEQYKEYRNLYNNEFNKHKQILSELQTLLLKTNSSIGDVFDFYDNKFRIDDDSRKRARHIYNDVHLLIMKSLQEELSLQPPQKIKDILNYYRDIEIESLKIRSENLLFPYEKTIHEGIYTLNRLIDKDKKASLFNDVVQKILEVRNFFKTHEEAINSSIRILKRGLTNNKLEEFKLQENYKLYHLYNQFLYLLEHIQKSPINWIDKELPYLYTGKIVEYGAEMSIIHELSSKVSFFTYEK